MSDYHILSADAWGNSLNVVMHFPVPAGTNSVGVAWQSIQATLWGSATSIVPTISPTEQAQLDAGAAYEHSFILQSHPGEDATAKRDRLDVLYASEMARVLAELSNRLAFWGYERDVP